MKIIKVTWKDAAFYSKVRDTKENILKEASTKVVVDVGILVSDKEDIYIAQTKVEGRYHKIMVIPKEAVIKIEELHAREDNNTPYVKSNL